MEAYTNRIQKAVYTKEFREDAVKLAMTDGVGILEVARFIPMVKVSRAPNR